MSADEPLRVLMFCTGTGIYNRGVETLFREMFDGLRAPLCDRNIDLRFLTGGGPTNEYEARVWCLRRTGRLAKLLGRCVRRDAYTIEQLTFLPGLIRRIRAIKPHVVYYGDGAVARRLYAWRNRIGVPYRLAFNNGAPLHPPQWGVEMVHQVAPFYYDEAIAAGESKERNVLIPQGIIVPDGNPVASTPGTQAAARAELCLPLERKIVISVGAVGMHTHKRVPYTISEIARIAPETRPFLLLLGAFDETTPQVQQDATRLLGAGNFAIRSVPYEQVCRYYHAADVFTLGSVKEGFGRVYIEALCEGLACVVHDQAVMRYVLGEHGIFADFTCEGTMSEAITQQLLHPNTPADMMRRREYVRARFSWNVLAPDYARMFEQCAALLLV